METLASMVSLITAIIQLFIVLWDIKKKQK